MGARIVRFLRRRERDEAEPEVEALGARSRGRPRLGREHRKAVVEAEVRMLASELEPFGMLSREELASRTHAALWHEGTFDTALHLAIKCGAVELSPTGLVVLRRRPTKREIRAIATRGQDEGGSDREHVAELLERAGEHHARAADALERAAAERQARSEEAAVGKRSRPSQTGEKPVRAEGAQSPRPVETEKEAKKDGRTPADAGSSKGAGEDEREG